MKRTIKFRGKCLTKDGWAYGMPLASQFGCSYMITEQGQHSADFFFSRHTITAIDEAIAVGTETVGQFTGLKDKNGVEIYEGDVVRYETDYDLMRFEVKWNKDTLMWEATSKEIVNEPLYYKNGFIEIIGNIHDNPELIERIEE